MPYFLKWAHIMEFLKRKLGETIQKRTIWDVYISLKNSDKRYSMATNNKRETSMLDKYTSLLKTNKNLILTGAPGTGKTYLAKAIAKAINAEIGFVQFHPSYDYTDFVEGLRPKNYGTGNVGFERKDGVFKEFCKRALQRIQISAFDRAYDELFDAIKNSTVQTIPLKSGKQSTLLSVSQDGTIKWVSAKNDSVDVNSVSKPRLRRLFEVYNSIEKLLNIGNVNEEIRGIIGGCNTTYYWAILYEVLKRIGQKSGLCVFIIDEINRGEISKIFGELFFSIDPGYRGEKGKVNTQYQNMIEEGDVFKDGFYVPDNVYIIGTMNDIDRSVESMDFAMRRRFAWQEVTAEESYTNMIENDPEFVLVKDEIKQRMFSLNKAIAETEGLDEAYQIGAAYFRKYLDYQDKTNPFDCLWENHLKGLLFEYLRGNRRAKELLEKLHDAYNKKSLNE